MDPNLSKPFVHFVGRTHETDETEQNQSKAESINIYIEATLYYFEYVSL